jgi:hypothetical protein
MFTAFIKQTHRPDDEDSICVTSSNLYQTRGRNVLEDSLLRYRRHADLKYYLQQLLFMNTD